MMRRARGFTLVEVLVALVVVALGLSALMVAVSGTARTTGYLRDKTLAQYIALNRLTEVRLNTTKFGPTTDTGELNFAGRTWHYDTRYFDTSFSSMKRVVVRVYLGDAKTKGNPVAETTGFTGAALGQPGGTPQANNWLFGPNGGGAAAAGTTNAAGTAGGAGGVGGVAPAQPPGTVNPTSPTTPVAPNGAQNGGPTS